MSEERFASVWDAIEDTREDAENMKFVVCINKEGFGDLSSEDVAVGRVYETSGNPDQHGMIRIIDQSGEDYLYPASSFESVTLSGNAEHRLHDALSQLS